MTMWKSTCNPCFSTFEQIFFCVSWIKKLGFFCYSLKLNFICYLNRFFTFDYSLWDRGRHTFLRAKTNFNFKHFCLLREIFVIFMFNVQYHLHKVRNGKFQQQKWWKVMFVVYSYLIAQCHHICMYR